MTENVKLRPEERRLRALLSHTDALGFAHDALLREEWGYPETKAEMLDALQDLRVEAHERFELCKRELGSPRSPDREEMWMDENTPTSPKGPYLDALEAVATHLVVLAEETEKLRLLREYQLGARVTDTEGSLNVRPVEEK